MKIVHVFKDFYPPLAAGVTRYIADVSEAMALRGHEVEVHVAGVAHSRQDRLASGVVVHRHHEMARVLSMPLAPGLVREVRALAADVLHVHLPNPIGEIGVVLNHGPSVVASFHARLGKQRMLEPFYRPLRNGLLDKVASILVSSDAVATAPELAGFRRKIRVLPYGVSPGLVGSMGRDAGLAGGPLHLLFVGRLVYYKGIDVLLRALVEVSEATLCLVGDGANRTALEALAAELGVAARTEFRGSVPDSELAECYAAADVFVLPSVSRAEAFGMAMTEAMMNGVPAISTALGTGTDWVNLDGHTGLVVPPNDAGALAAAIVKLRDPDLRARLAGGAAQRATLLFSFDRHITGLEAVYREAVA